MCCCQLHHSVDENARTHRTKYNKYMIRCLFQWNIRRFCNKYHSKSVCGATGPFSAGTDFRRQNLMSKDVIFWRSPRSKGIIFLGDVGIHMNQKELHVTKTFIMISNWKIWSPWFIHKYFSVVRVSRIGLHSFRLSIRFLIKLFLIDSTSAFCWYLYLTSAVEGLSAC